MLIAGRHCRNCQKRSPEVIVLPRIAQQMPRNSFYQTEFLISYLWFRDMYRSPISKMNTFSFNQRQECFDIFEEQWVNRQSSLVMMCFLSLARELQRCDFTGERVGVVVVGLSRLCFMGLGLMERLVWVWKVFMFEIVRCLPFEAYLFLFWSFIKVYNIQRLFRLFYEISCPQDFNINQLFCSMLRNYDSLTEYISDYTAKTNILFIDRFTCIVMQSEQKVTKRVKSSEKIQAILRSKLQTKSPQKKHGETPHECLVVVDEHLGQNHVVHHHFGQHHPHYYHIEPEWIIKPEQLVDPNEYLMSVHKMKEKVDSYYMKNTQEYVDYWKREYNVDFSLQGYQLIFYDIVVDMEQFLKQDWRNVEYIGFAGAKIDDIKWRLFADHADLFPNLKWLSLQIKHTINVKQGDLERFKSLQRIQFNYEQWTHPLTIPSKNYLKQFAKAHQNIQIVFG